MTKEVTLEHIARRANVSTAAVSLALRNKPGVGESTRANVLQIAEELGYQARVGETGLAASQVRHVAVFMISSHEGPEREQPALNHFYSGLLSAVQHEADKRNMNIVLGSIPVNWDNEIVEFPPQRIFDSGRDGVLLLGMFRPETIAQLQAHISVPIVCANGVIDGHDNDVVTTDNVHAAREATRHLIGKGHRRIAYFGNVNNTDVAFNEREAGYLEAMTEIGEEPIIIPVSQDESLPVPLPALPVPFTAAVCRNDHAAWLVSRQFKRDGIRIPDDVSMVAIDNVEYTRLHHPPMSAMSIDLAAMGMLAVQLLETRIRHPQFAPVKTMLRSRLVERESVISIDQPRREEGASLT